MTAKDKARRFAELHRGEAPLVLWNIWDAGGAKVLATAGAPGVATSSWSIAGAHGYPDGETIPLDFVLRIVERIVQSVDIPVTVDFEGAYAIEPGDVRENVQRLIGTGAIGINFEDGRIGKQGLYSKVEQAGRIAACREAAEGEGAALFINARTDLFLQEQDHGKHGDLVGEAIARGRAYQDAGANGFFVPGLDDPVLIRAICERVHLPINIMMTGANSSVNELASYGVARVSYGPVPFFTALDDLKIGWVSAGG